MNLSKTPTIFIVEDDKFYGEILRKELEQKQYTQIELHESGEDCINNLYKMPDIILLDFQLHESFDGLEVLKKIKAFNPDIQVIMLSGQNELKVAVNSLKYGAFDYVIKNDDALSQIDLLIKKISKWNEIVVRKNRQKKTRKLITLGVSLVAGLVLLFNNI